MSDTTMSRAEALARLTAPGAPFERVECLVDGVPMQVFASAPTSLAGVLEGTRAHGDRDFLVFEDERYTFREHLDIVSGLARWLSGQGVVKGDRVAIGMRNYPQWLMAFWATQALGAVAVPLNAWWTAPELRYALDDSGARFAVLDGERYDRIAADLDELTVPALVVHPVGPLGPNVWAWADVYPTFDADGVLPEVEIDPDDPSTIVYTSGTTGSPKGALGTHRNHVTNIFNAAQSAAIESMTASPAPADPATPPTSPAALHTYPFFHVGGLTVAYLMTSFGVKLVLQRKWDLEEAFDLIERERVTSMAAVPTLLRQLLEAPDLDERDLSSVTALSSGGAPVPPDLVAKVELHFGTKVSSANGYGLTETTGGVTGNRGASYVARPNSVGRPVDGVEVRVVDPGTGVDVTPGEVGELWFRGAVIARGYWNKPEATAEAFTDGWFHTGDLGHVDDDGFVYVVDRLKDVVIRGGENVYCAEVEAALFEHPAVADVAIIGVPHRELGEQVAAVILVREGDEVSVEEIQDHVRGRLAHFKVPEVVVFRTTELPRTATGKVLKRDLRDGLVDSD